MSNYNSALQSNNTDLQTVLQTLQTKAAGGEQATPVISVNSNGLITATAGSKSSTYQLAFQPAKTITPTTTTQTAVPSGYYTGGNITVKGDANLVAGNIKSGVSIFGVSGTYEGSGSSGGDTSMEDAIINKTISGTYINNRVTKIGTFMFNACYSLTAASFPNVASIGVGAFCNCTRLSTISFPGATFMGASAFSGCIGLTAVSFPNVTSIGASAFCDCIRLRTISFPVAKTIAPYAFNGCSSNLWSVFFPKVTKISSYAFNECYNLSTASFPKVTNISSYAFSKCYTLKSLYLTGSSVCKLSGSTAFASTPIGGYSTSAATYGSIYVPASLLTAYKTATNWTYFSSRFVGI